MALVVEDGTGINNANAYVSVAEADAYFTARNITSWVTRNTPDKEKGILYATSFLDSQFYWYGHIKRSEQALGWPRILVYDTEGRSLNSGAVPQRVKDAACELALEALDKPLSPSLARGGAIKRQRVSSLEIEYFEKASSDRTFPIVRQILRGLYKDSPTAELFRA
ncbi:MAG: hypothetical protein K2Q12_10865 [Rickettsiales bacterium]|jgi:hypothetical protein|nr:hypothetical protein [Rickettsiales bacterium]NBX02617.1 hypothetical protein [Alphaproteobacteria bacterium]